MLTAEILGRLGADAEVKTANGKEFVSFNVSHSENYLREDGTKVENTIWISCTMNGNGGTFIKHLKKGKYVYVSGRLSVRIFDSARDHCKKVGINVNVRTIELAGSTDEIPSELYTKDGEPVSITKKYYCNKIQTKLKSIRGIEYETDRNGKIITEEDSQPF